MFNRHTVLDAPVCMTPKAKLKMIKAGRLGQRWQQPPSILHVGDILQSGHRAVTHHGSWTQADQTRRGCHAVNVSGAHYSILL